MYVTCCRSYVVERLTVMAFGSSAPLRVEHVCSVLGHRDVVDAGQSVSRSPCSHGQLWTVSVREPLRIFITQCALAWSWMGEAWPGVHTRMSCNGWSAMRAQVVREIGMMLSFHR